MDHNGRPRSGEAFSHPRGDHDARPPVWRRRRRSGLTCTTARRPTLPRFRGSRPRPGARIRPLTLRRWPRTQRRTVAMPAATPVGRGKTRNDPCTRPHAARLRQNQTVSNPLRRVRDLLFVDADTIRVNCGRCGKELLVRLGEIRDERVIDCGDCKAADAGNHRRDERASRQSTLSRRMC